MEKKLHLEILRIVAISMVVFNHTDGFFLYFSTTGHPLTYLYSIVFSTLCRVAVPLFFMISGAVLLGKEEPLKELWRKRIFRILAVMMVFSFLYYSLDIVRQPEAGFSVGEFIAKLFSGRILESFWFLYAYLGMLVLLPFLRRLASGMTKTLFIYLIILKNFLDVILLAQSILTGYAVNDGLFILETVVYYPLMGFCLERYGEEKGITRRGMVIAVSVLLLCIVLTAILEEWVKIRSGDYQLAILDIFVPVLTLAFWYGAKWLGSKVRNERIMKWLIRLGESTFLVYLLEKAVRIQLLPVYLWLSEYTFGMLACTFYVIGTLAGAYFYAILVRKLPAVRKYL